MWNTESVCRLPLSDGILCKAEKDQAKQEIMMTKTKGEHALVGLRELCDKARYWGVYATTRDIMIGFLIRNNVIEPIQEIEKEVDEYGKERVQR